ncbi:hypothetical protein L2E82_02052 [Cichorium intybus]|uniref:Uncharacterized protein n=1 Tax=Cichorium intybus TaxID=13427 RepID=A0ACB9H259_CICIN|nr:hypothetical protein L2E82_02052 [Cichorium intybus]
MLARNVEDYSGSVARMIAAVSCHLIKGILWCGDVIVDRLKWGNDFLKKKTKPGSKYEVSPQSLKRVRVGVATEILSGVVKVSGYLTDLIVNLKPGKKFFNLIPGEIILVSLDDFNMEKRDVDNINCHNRLTFHTADSAVEEVVVESDNSKAFRIKVDKLTSKIHSLGLSSLF